jgi:hypothetical protein
MVNHPAQPPPPPDAGDNHANEEKTFEELRTLLLGTEQQQLATLRERVQNPELRAQDVSGVVAEAIELRRGPDGGHGAGDPQVHRRGHPRDAPGLQRGAGT